jgi:hypothetical protein
VNFTVRGCIPFGAVAGILCSILFTLSVFTHAYDVTLARDTNHEPHLAGYILYVKEGDSDLPEYHLDALSVDEIEPHNPTYTVTGLKDNTHYCFLIKVYPTEGYEVALRNCG